MERIVVLYISQDFNFPVYMASLDLLYLHGSECLHSQLQHDKIAKKKILPIYQLPMYLHCPHSCSLFFGNLVICLFLLKYVISLLNLTSLFMQWITSSGHFKMQPQTTNIKRIFILQMHCQKDECGNSVCFAWFWYLVLVLRKWRRKWKLFWVTIDKLFTVTGIEVWSYSIVLQRFK